MFSQFFENLFLNLIVNVLYSRSVPPRTTSLRGSIKDQLTYPLEMGSVRQLYHKSVLKVFCLFLKAVFDSSLLFRFFNYLNFAKFLTLVVGKSSPMCFRCSHFKIVSSEESELKRVVFVVFVILFVLFHFLYFS